MKKILRRESFLFSFFISILIPLILLLSLHGCAEVIFRSEGEIFLSTEEREDHTHFLEILGVKEFYLWGKINPDPVVHLDEEFANRGYYSIAELKTSSYQSSSQLLISFLSFGLYTPITYRLRGKTFFEK